MTSVPVLHVVTDDDVLARPDVRALATTILKAGGSRTALHVRGPRTNARLLHELVAELRPVASSCGAGLVVNDRVDVALAAGVRRVHLGERSLPLDAARSVLGEGAKIGLSTHDVPAVARAAREGANWVFVGTIFPTASHPGRAGLGCGALEAAVSVAAGVPVVAIGGITPERVADVGSAGARSVAVLRGVWASPDPGEAVNRYLEALADA